MQVARHSGEAPRRRGWAAEPSFRAFAPGGDSARELTPGSRSRGSIHFGEPMVPPNAPPYGYRTASVGEAGMNPASRRLRPDRLGVPGSVLVPHLTDRRYCEDGSH